MPEGKIPRPIKKGGTAFKGLSIREVLIVVVGLSLAIITAMAPVGLPVWLRAGLAVLVAGVALALAFGTHRGQTAEQLLAHWVAHVVRPRRMVWRRGGEGIPEVVVEAGQEAELQPEAERCPEPVEGPVPAGPAARPIPVRAGEDWVNLWFALVNALLLAAMSSLTVYLGSGGAEELRLWWAYKLR